MKQIAINDLKQISINDLPDWINSNEKVAVYHIGDLARDRDGQHSRLKLEDRKTLDVMAGIMWKLSERKLVHLVQKKIETGKYAYMAIKDSSFERNFKLEDIE